MCRQAMPPGRMATPDSGPPARRRGVIPTGLPITRPAITPQVTGLRQRLAEPVRRGMPALAKAKSGSTP